MKKNANRFAVIFFLLLGIATVCASYEQSLKKGTFVGELTFADLTPAEQKDLPYLFHNESYVAIRLDNGKIVHAVRKKVLVPGQSVTITKFMNNGMYLIK